MDVHHAKATVLWSNLGRLDMPQIRAFHMSWFAFLLCFCAWFGIAPLMPIVREELRLTQNQVGWAIIGSVAITVVARLWVGWLCDRIGPRLTYTWLLVASAIPVMGIGLAHDFTTFLVFRVLIGAIGASFVITQYHTSIMFAPNVVGAANATSAGWGNTGGGVTHFVMPLLYTLFVSTMGFSPAFGWRACMFAMGMLCLVTAAAYYLFTQDAPQGSFRELRAAGRMRQPESSNGAFWRACADRRVWALFLLYGACFGIELTIDNIAALYFTDYFGLGLTAAGSTAAAFGLMGLFARTMGGMAGDAFGLRFGLRGRVLWLFMAILCEGLLLMLFSQTGRLAFALPALMVFGLFVHMACGATYSVVPFVRKEALGAVAGIVGAGGNVGAVAAGFLFKSGMEWPTALLILGMAVTCVAPLAFAVRFTPEAEANAAREYRAALEKTRRPAASLADLHPAISS